VSVCTCAACSTPRVSAPKIVHEPPPPHRPTHRCQMSTRRPACSTSVGSDHLPLVRLRGRVCAQEGGGGGGVSARSPPPAPHRPTRTGDVPGAEDPRQARRDVQGGLGRSRVQPRVGLPPQGGGACVQGHLTPAPRAASQSEHLDGVEAEDPPPPTIVKARRTWMVSKHASGPPGARVDSMRCTGAAGSGAGPVLRQGP